MNEIWAGASEPWAVAGSKTLLYNGGSLKSGFAANITISDDSAKALGSRFATQQRPSGLWHWHVAVFGGVELIQTHINLGEEDFVFSCGAADYDVVSPHVYELLELEPPVLGSTSQRGIRAECRVAVSRPSELKVFAGSLTADEVVFTSGGQELRSPQLAAPGVIARLGFVATAAVPETLPDLGSRRLYDLHTSASGEFQAAAQSVVWKGDDLAGGLILKWVDGVGLYELTKPLEEGASVSEFRTARVEVDPGSFWVNNMSPRTWMS